MDRPRHAIRSTQNRRTKRIVDIMFNGFSFGTPTQGSAIDNFVMDGNVSFNHGVLSANLGADLLLGGGKVAQTPSSPTTSVPAGLGGRGADIGYGTPCADSTVQNNVFASDWAST
jgi:hypothetical protein